MSERPKVWKGWSHSSVVDYGRPYVTQSDRSLRSDEALARSRDLRPCIVQDLPEGCPEEFPLPRTKVVYDGEEWRVFGPPERYGDEFKVPLYKVFRPVRWVALGSIDWPGKPKPEPRKQRLRLTFEVSEGADVSLMSKDIEHLVHALLAAYIPFGGNGLVLDRVEGLDD